METSIFNGFEPEDNRYNVKSPIPYHVQQNRDKGKTAQALAEGFK